MEIIARLFNRLGKWEYLGLGLLVLVLLILHLSIIMQPDTPLFDEQHYVPDARLIIDGDGTVRTEHPPLGKLFIVSGIKLFGDNPFGWRFFSVLLGTGGIIIFYLICRRLNLSTKVSFLATFLVSLENLTFVHAGIAMLDVFSLFFSLVAFWLYLKNKHLYSGMAVGLAALAKLNGALALIAIGLHWFLVGRRRPWRFLASMTAAPASFLLLLPVLGRATGQMWLNPITQIDLLLARVQNMLELTASIVYNGVGSDIGARPWEWVLFPENMPYWWTPHYTGMISPTLWALILPAMAYITYRAIKGNTPALFPFSWFVATYLLWIPASLITDRVTYIFYFLPTIGAIAIAIAMGLFWLMEIAEARGKGKLRRLIRIAVLLYLLLHVIAFIVLVPVSPMLSVPLGLLLYLFTIRFLGMEKWLGYRGSAARPRNQVAKPGEQ
jgi:predicted membrane-bound dolichyl-phosphate-mannose-protein mannosyltransferase